eukprot:TRINITY_DN1576_c0_g1_i1.p1 TRINITY_DN1576_c0_g1~~TRINITY_DN1576_c0_g1_i1.p1  ORF type:complete len:310 (+),score=105.74 TRINITY_DN1576_c0_g1_i1:49-930(+)
MAKVDVAQALSAKFPDKKIVYNRRDVILYALGVGAKDLKFTYEDDSDFATLPTFPVVLTFKGDSFDVVPFGASSGGFPGIEFDPSQILHGEQKVQIFQPLPQEGEFIDRRKILAVYDKGKGALIITENLIIDPTTQKTIARLESGVFIRGIGGFGGDRGPSGTPNVPPKRAPDVVHEEKTDEHQAVLYRLSGDYNPLHVDVGMAQMVGFQKPILHGLCSFGFAARAVLLHFCNNDPQLFKGIEVRFASPVLPGNVLVTEMWKEGNKVIFQTKVKETGKLVISNAAVELQNSKL